MTIPTISQSLTTPTTAPARTQDKDTFNTNVDNRLAWESTNVTEHSTLKTEYNAAIAAINLILPDIDNAETVSEVALAGANFKGNYSSQTGAANKPYSVAHLSKYWALNTNLADVTLKVPGTDVEWTEITFGIQGVENLTPAVSASLASDKLISTVAASADGVVMEMPAATSYDAGTLCKIIINIGAFPVSVVSKDGARILGTVTPQHRMYIHVYDVSTADGKYIVQTVAPGITRAPWTTFAAAGTAYMTGCAIGANKFALMYSDTGNSNYPTVIIGTQADGGFTFGTEVVLQSTASSSPMGICASEVDDEFVCVALGTAGSLDFFFVTVSGTVPTVTDTELSIETSRSTTYGCKICRVDTDKFLVVSCNTNPDVYGIIVNTSGTAYSTKGSATAITSGSGANPMVERATTNVAICAHSDFSSLNQVRILTVSGNVITVGAATNIGNINNDGRPKAIATSATSFVLVYTHYAAAITLSGISSYTFSGTTITHKETHRFDNYPEAIVGHIDACLFDDATRLIMVSSSNYSVGSLWNYRIYMQRADGGLEFISEKEVTNGIGMSVPGGTGIMYMFRLKDNFAIQMRQLTSNYGAIATVTADVSLT